MTMKKAFPVFLLILILAVAGCAVPETTPLPTATEAPAPLSTATPETVAEATTSPVPATEVPTATPEPANTPTATPTATPEPTSTPTATATTTPTATPTVTPTPAPQVRAVGKNVNVRRGPGTVFPVIAVLRDGQTAPVIARGPKGWLQINLNGKTGWVYSGVVEVSGPVETLAMAENIPTPPPTPTPVPPTATPVPTQVAGNPGQTVNPVGPLPPKQDVVYLTKDTQFPVRANRFIGWGYEIVDASERWDIVMYRDVFGYVLHEFFGDALYKEHPHGLRVTFLDCVPYNWPESGPSQCGGEELPIPVFQNDNSLGLFFGDGSGSEIGIACAAPSVNYYDPQECFIGLGQIDAGHLTDVVIASMITMDADRVGYNFFTNSPDFTKFPFTPHLGIAYKDESTQQWRWKDPFIKIVPQQP